MIKVSVVVVTYRRLERIPEVLAAWLEQTPDVWLCDCSLHGVKIVPPGTHVVRFRPDPGNRVRHAVALLTSGDLVIKADDDVVPKIGMVADFIKAHEVLGPAILGIHGRTFHGRDYYRDTKLFGAKAQKAPLKVDFVGVVTCAPRALLPMDLKACGTETEDLYWQMQCYPKAPKFIIPTDKYANLPECKDAARLCGNPAARQVRRRFYELWYLRNYKKPDGFVG